MSDSIPTNEQCLDFLDKYFNNVNPPKAEQQPKEKPGRKYRGGNSSPPEIKREKKRKYSVLNGSIPETSEHDEELKKQYKFGIIPFLFFL